MKLAYNQSKHSYHQKFQTQGMILRVLAFTAEFSPCWRFAKNLLHCSTNKFIKPAFVAFAVFFRFFSLEHQPATTSLYFYIHFLELGVVSSWTSWTECSLECRRGITFRTRICFSLIADPAQFTCGTDLVSTKEEKACLDLDGCDGSRLYLADDGVSCTDFCVQKGYPCFFYPIHLNLAKPFSSCFHQV